MFVPKLNNWLLYCDYINPKEAYKIWEIFTSADTKYYIKINIKCTNLKREEKKKNYS